MNYKRISIRVDSNKDASNLLGRVQASIDAGIEHNTIIEISYDNSPAGSAPELFIKTLAYVEKILAKYPDIQITGITYGPLPKLYLYIPESVNKIEFVNEWRSFFQRRNVKKVLGEVWSRFSDFTDSRIRITQQREVIDSSLQGVKSVIDTYKINEGQDRNATDPEKECLRKMIYFIIKHYSIYHEKTIEFENLKEGIEELMSLRQSVDSIIAFVAVTAKLSKEETKRFISSVVGHGYMPQEIIRMIEIINELKTVDTHLSQADVKDSRKAKKSARYLIWKSYNIAKKKMGGILSSASEDNIKKIAFRALVLSTVMRYVSVKHIPDEEERKAIAYRMYYIDSLVARDLNMEAYQYRIRSKVFEITHPEEVIVINEEYRRRFGGRTEAELIRGLKELKEFFEAEFVSSLLSDIDNEVETFFSLKRKLSEKERYFILVKPYIQGFYSNKVSPGSPMFNFMLIEIKDKLKALAGITDVELDELMETIETFLRTKKIPEIQMRLKTVHSIYEKARRIKYDQLKKEYEKQARKFKGSEEIAPFDVQEDDIDITIDELITIMRLDIAGVDDQIVEQYKRIMDDAILDLAAMRFIVEYSQEREAPLEWLKSFGLILWYENINKANGYRAIHIKLLERLFFDGVLEIQIRDREAHIQAEEGDAHHRVYKGGEQLPALNTFAIFGIMIERLKKHKFIPVIIEHYTKSDQIESISQDLLILEEDANEFDLLVQGGYYSSCSNEKDVKAKSEAVTIIKVKTGFIKVYSDRLIGKVNTLKSKLKIKIAMALGSDPVQYAAQLESIKVEYEPFANRLKDLALLYNLDDVEMLYGGMLVDYDFKEIIDRQLGIKPEIEIKRVKKVAGKDKREVEVSTRITITVPDRIGLLNFWLNELYNMGFNKLESADCDIVDADKFRAVLLFTGNITDDISSAIRVLIGKATEYFRNTKEKQEEERTIDLSMTVTNGISNLISITNILRLKGIKVVSFKIPKDEKAGDNIRISLTISMPERQFEIFDRIYGEIGSLPFVHIISREDDLEY